MNRIGGKSNGFLAKFFVHLFEEDHPDQYCIIRSIPQRRKREMNHSQSIVQILTKGLINHRLRKICIGRCDYSDIELDLMASTNAFDRLVLEEA